MVEAKPTHIIRTEKFEGYMLNDNTLYLHYFYNQEIDVEEIRSGFELHENLNLDDNLKRIVHCEKFVSITRDARELVQNHGKPAKAEAYVIPYLPQKIIFNLYVKFRKRKHPVKAFDTLEGARAWLDQF